MGTGQWVLAVYALLMFVGGVMGSRAGSRVSLYAGGASGFASLVALGVTFSNLQIGLWIGCALAVLLTLMFGKRLAATGKWMPSGMLLIMSLAAAAFLAYTAAMLR